MTLKNELCSIDSYEVEAIVHGFVQKFGSLASGSDDSASFNEEASRLQAKYPALIGNVILGVKSIAEGAGEAISDDERDSMITGAAFACLILAELAEVRELPVIE